MKRISSDNIQTLKENEIFVFGSNESGIHGAGAAKLACEKFGAEYRKSFGIQGQSFAIPTKDKNIETLPLYKVNHYVKLFKQFALNNDDLKFFVTEIGCGLAGYTIKDIAPLFYDFIGIDNVYLPKSFWEYFENRN